MSASSQIPLRPVVSYPRVAEVGRTYMLTVDFQAPEGAAGEGWGFPDEEFVVHCELEAAPLFSHRPVGDAAVVLHRFGGSYGPATFLLTAGEHTGSGTIDLHLSSAQGLPLASITLPGVTVRARGLAPAQRTVAPTPAERPGPVEAEEPEALGGIAEEELFSQQAQTAAQAPMPPPPDAPPLDRELAARLAAGLRDYWITSAEELADIARGPNQQYGSGLAALAVALQVDEAQVTQLVAAAAAAAPPTPDPRSLTPLWRALGLDEPPSERAEPPGPTIAWPRPALERPATQPGAKGGAEVELPAAVEPPAMPPVGHNGTRNTVVAFTGAAMYQALSGDLTPLSAQFLYWACKERDNIKGDVGTSPTVMLDVLAELGICTEATWPYNPTPRQEDPGQGPPPAGALEEARLRRISGSAQLPGKDVRQIKAALASGRPVLLGLRISEHWTGTWHSQALGKLRKPLPGEQQRGGTSLCALGYRDDPEAPGGGYFIARNCWGADWGSNNPDGPGYAHIPYQLVAEQGLAAFAATGALPNPQQEAASQPDREQAAGWLDLRSGERRARPVAASGVGPDGRPLLLIDDEAIARIAQSRFTGEGTARENLHRIKLQSAQSYF